MVIHAIDSTDFYREFGALIRRRRDTLKQTQLELASKVGLTRASIANIETGRQKVLFHQVALFARALELDVKDLVPAPALRQGPGTGVHKIKIPLSVDLNDRQKQQVLRLLQASYRAPRGATSKD